MGNTEIPENYTGKIILYYSIEGLEIDMEKPSKTPIGSILGFIADNGQLLAKYTEKYDEKGILVYSYYH